ncbi:plastocyanin/azurin family copper-binding protein [Autumnicola edwardsiae]|uniref:Plastocyanin/azurin family copper-binding protein n=1 Tax=Autumnicola edwardsiae TaxID=3075594 RepID=A0ABU3CW87_9FLAO|nr:plastocyanin/azurin family copper-binding protein [Zunongwangia sp. F297]MDT0650629.1 plastocyanin/azurin family copper-binding protein [Zunongwangia sp. F297]
MYRSFFILLFLVFSFSFTPLEGNSQNSPPTETAPREIFITSPGLLYDVVRFKVKPGEVVKITLENTDEMSHNLLITEPGTREEVVSLAAKLIGQQDSNDFVPKTEMVLNYIPILKPGEKKSIMFQAPEEEGVYSYVCTFPGHGSIMYGAIYVTENDEMPDLEDDPNIPPQDKQNPDEHMAVKLPAIYRTFMPDSGPASIAVGMPGDISYCWDAGQCRLRYAWQGGFVDLEKNWAGNGNDKAEVVGTVFFRDETEFPIRIGAKNYIPKPEYKGYRMENRYPSFQYLLDEIKVTEKITPLTETSGFKREFVFEHLYKPLWFFKGDNQVEINSSRGKWEGKYFKLNPGGEETRLIITVKNG